MSARRVRRVSSSSATGDGYHRAMRVTASTRIESPPERVFDTLADVRNDARWNSRVSSAELRSPEPIGLGSRFAMVNGESVRRDDHDARSAVMARARGAREARSHNRVYVVAGGAGTDLDSDFDFRPAGAQKLLFALVGPVIRREIPNSSPRSIVLRVIPTAHGRWFMAASIRRRRSTISSNCSADGSFRPRPARPCASVPRRRR